MSKRINKKRAKQAPQEKDPPKKMGRPTKYKPEYCEQILEFFDRPLTRMVKKQSVEYGKVIEIEEEEANIPPMFGTFARSIGVYHETMTRWTKDHEDFCRAYKEAKQLQRDWIVMGALMGKLQGNFARFTMKNISEWRDQVQNVVDPNKGGLSLAYSNPEKTA